MAPEDYESSNQQLIFATGISRVCHFVNIINDTMCEINPTEDFFPNLELAFGENIIVDPPQAQVIINDTNQPECGELDNIRIL